MPLLASLFSWLKPAPSPDAEVLKALERIGVLVSPLLPATPGFVKTLALPVRNALDYCRRLVDQIPGPQAINRHAFANDPLVHALFATADDIHHMLGKSPSVREHLQQTGALEGDCFYALLAARRQCKKTTGVAMQDGIVRSDVPLEYLFFSDHLLADTAATPEATREILYEKSFDNLLRTFRSHLDRAREQRDELRENRDLERGQISLLRGQGTVVAIDTHTRRLNALENELGELSTTLQPDEILATLANFLMVPETAMRIEPVTLAVDRTGIVTHATPDTPGVDVLRFQQFTGRDRRSYVVMIAGIRRDDAQAAVAELRDLQRRVVII